jgi:DNA topoisomerase I
MARLRRVDCSSPGIVRRRRGRGFEFIDEDGNRVDDPEVLRRINELAIPPAWEDVWVCPYPMGHLQATGVDARGRKQYLYHPQWRMRQDQKKFDEMIAFARALPGMRRRIARDLESDWLSREQVLGCSVRLLDRGFFRVGGEDYAVENETYGLATIRKEHVRISKGTITFDYPAKSGQRRIQSIVDDQVHDIVAALKRRRGGEPELLAFKHGTRWRDIKSADINTYVKEVTGGDFSAKDFRTWNATVLASVALAVSGPVADASKTARKRAKTRAVKEVAHYLGNTPAVCRASYIDPRVFDAFDARLTVRPALERVAANLQPGELPIHQPALERAVLDLIGERSPRSAGVEKVAA